MKDAARINSRLLIPAALFFVSGAASLVYEIVWERLLQLYFGVTLISVTLIVGAYMAGLGLGSLVGGRLARRLRSPLRAYGWIEIAIGAFGLASPFVINEVGQRTAGSAYPTAFLLSFALLLIPTFLMGATLPILVQALVDRVENAGRVVGLLYGINTLGAALGAALAGYVLIGLFGFYGAIQAACLLNVLAGTAAIVLSSRTAASTQGNAPQRSIPKTQAQGIAWTLPYIFLAAFLIGFVHLGLEMVWFRILSVVNKSSAYGFPTMLAVYLMGLAIGSMVWGRRADRARDPVRLFWGIELWVGILALLPVLLGYLGMQVPSLQPWFQTTFHSEQLPHPALIHTQNGLIFSRRALALHLIEYLAPVLVLVLPASIAMGAGLPILDRILISSRGVAGRRVGDAHLMNILGSVAGILATTFVLLPLLGSELSLKLLGALCIVFVVMDISLRGRSSLHRVAYFQIAVLFVLLWILPGRADFFRRYFELGTGSAVITDESGDAVLTLALDPASGAPTGLWIGGIQNSYYPSTGGYERSILTCAAAARPTTVLIIGLGGGNTALLASTLPGVEKVVVVELLRELPTLISRHVHSVTSLFDNSRVVHVVDDGRRYLYAHPQERYDLIFLDPLYSFTAGHNNLYSLEAMRLYSAHLSDGGVFCPWMDEREILPWTTSLAFPDVDYFGDFSVAGKQPLRYSSAYFQDSVVSYKTSLGPNANADIIEMASNQASLPGLRADQASLRERSAGGPFLSDMHPWLEYYLFLAPGPR